MVGKIRRQELPEIGKECTLRRLPAMRLTINIRVISRSYIAPAGWHAIGNG
jgi:hypothetical protein